jgi:hypothetical protein
VLPTALAATGRVAPRIRVQPSVPWRVFALFSSSA